jgi:hypothetical protein
MKLLIMQSSLASYHVLPLTTKYSPQRPVLKHLQFVFILLVCETKCHIMWKPLNIPLAGFFTTYNYNANILKDRFKSIPLIKLTTNSTCCHQPG